MNGSHQVIEFKAKPMPVGVATHLDALPEWFNTEPGVDDDSCGQIVNDWDDDKAWTLRDVWTLAWLAVATWSVLAVFVVGMVTTWQWAYQHAVVIFK